MAVYLSISMRAVIATVFVVSALSKLIGPSAFPAFVRSLHRMRVLPAPIVRPAAAVVVGVEVLIVAGVVTPVRAVALAGLVLAALMLTAFTIAIAAVVRRGISEPCQCFGRTATPLGPQHIGRNILLLLIVAAGLWATSVGATAEIGTLLVAALAGVLLGFLVTRFDDLFDLFRPASARATDRHA